MWKGYYTYVMLFPNVSVLVRICVVVVPQNTKIIENTSNKMSDISDV